MNDARLIAERITTKSAELSLQGGCYLGVSIGITHYEEGDGAQEMVHRADEALYRIKEAGKGSVEVHITAKYNISY